MQNYNHKNESVPSKYKMQDFLPLIIIFGLIIAFTIGKQILYGWHMYTAMSDFMGAFFVIFGLFKIVNLYGFVEAYRMYDIVAQRSMVYAYIYPFIELILGIAYLTQFQLFLTNVLTLILMFVSSIGVGLELAKGKKIVCACLGAVFKIPMTYVTLAEDIMMGIMALIMLFMA